MAKKVLVVDDEKLIVKGIRFSLEQDGMQVDCAYDGQEAIDLATNNKYDIILLDVMLPKIDGFELLEYIKQFDIPTIFITAKSDIKDKVKGLSGGADDYITKPFDISELQARVEVVLRRYKKQQAKFLKNIELDQTEHEENKKVINTLNDVWTGKLEEKEDE